MGELKEFPHYEERPEKAPPKEAYGHPGEVIDIASAPKKEPEPKIVEVPVENAIGEMEKKDPAAMNYQELSQAVAGGRIELSKELLARLPCSEDEKYALRVIENLQLINKNLERQLGDQYTAFDKALREHPEKIVETELDPSMKLRPKPKDVA